MRVFATILGCLLLTGCIHTIPERPRFPEPADVLLELCPELHKVPEGTTELSVVLDRVTMNYAEYHICAARHEQLVKWYEEVKEIYNNID